MRIPGWIAIAGFALALIVVIGLSGEERAYAQGVVNFDVDPDITGNTASTLGTVEDCVEINPGALTFDGTSDYTIDIVVTGDTQAPIAYDAGMSFDDTVVHIVQPPSDELIKLPGASTFTSYPDTVSPYNPGAIYLSGGPGTAGNGTIVRVGLDLNDPGGTGVVVTFTNLPDPATAYASALGTHPTTVDGAQLAINTPCPQLADVKIVSQSLTSPPTQMDIDTPTDFTLHKVLHNNGPIGPVDVSILTSVGKPADCSITGGSGPDTETLPVSVDVPVDEVIQLSCSQPSTHSFTFTNSIDITTPSVTDPDTNNNSASTPINVDVLADADLEITDVTVTAPATENATVQFVVGATVDVTNNGSYSPVNANVTSTLDLTSAPGCTTSSLNPQVDALMGLGSDTAAPSWNVTCTTTGLKTFDVDASVAVTTSHVSDPTPGNDTGSGSDQTDITAPPTTADVQILSWVFPDNLPTIAGNQILVVPGTPELMTSTETLDNNGGTYPGANLDVDLTVTETPSANCSATPDAGNPTTQTIPKNGTDVVDTLAWNVGLTLADSCTIDFGKTVTITTAGVTDTDLSDNTASRTVALVGDTDSDGVPNYYQGLEDNCPNDPNPDQADNDEDGIGDVCDPDDDDDTVPDTSDNCPFVYNPDQLDTDGNGIGDACENDFDGDTVPDNEDNCRAVKNPSQADTDGDGVGDVCDNCPTVPNHTQTDTNNNGIGDACEEVTVTVTPTVTATAVVTETPTETGTGTATPVETAVPPGELCAPVIPGTYNGLVRLEGVPAADGYVVTASIDGMAWGDTLVSGGRYALDVPESLPATPPCFEGGTITFTLNGAVCDETVEWASGLHDLDLNCAAAPLPTATPPISTPPVGPGTPVATPVAPPPTGGGGLSPLSDLSWVTALAAGAVLAWVLAAAGLFHTIRRRAG